MKLDHSMSGGDEHPCPTCGGEGTIDGLVIGDRCGPEVCRRCRGTGTVRWGLPDDGGAE